MSKSKIFTLFFIASIFVACQNKQKTTVTESGELLGEISLTDLEEGKHSEWYWTAYQGHQVISRYSKPIAMTLENKATHIVVVLGTWCDDSKTLVPALFRVLNDINYDKNKVKLLAINEDKTEPADIIEKYHIQFVPTIMVFNNDQELGRIMEQPDRSLERDFLFLMN